MTSVAQNKQKDEKSTKKKKKKKKKKCKRKKKTQFISKERRVPIKVRGGEGREGSKEDRNLVFLGHKAHFPGPPFSGTLRSNRALGAGKVQRGLSQGIGRNQKHFCVMIKKRGWSPLGKGGSQLRLHLAEERRESTGSWHRNSVKMRKARSKKTGKL